MQSCVSRRVMRVVDSAIIVSRHCHDFRVCRLFSSLWSILFNRRLNPRSRCWGIQVVVVLQGW